MYIVQKMILLCGFKNLELRFKHKHERYPLLKSLSQPKPLIVKCAGGWNPKSFEYLNELAELIGS
jgi:hypothetical protein